MARSSLPWVGVTRAEIAAAVEFEAASRRPKPPAPKATDDQRPGALFETDPKTQQGGKR